MNFKIENRKEKIAKLERKIKLCNDFLEKTENKAHYENFIRKYSAEIERAKANLYLLKKLDKAIVPAISVIFILAMLFFLRPAFIGYFALENVSSYTQNIDTTFVEDSVYLLYLKHEGELKSLKLNGEIIGEGTAKIYLEAGNESYLVFDSTALEEHGITAITGLAVGEFNKTEENESIPSVQVNETILDELLNETFLANETVDLNETLVDDAQEEITNPPEDAKILIELVYNNGTEFDINNDGIEAREGIVDFKANAEFNWDVDEANLCTAWETYSIENESSVKVCYGNEKCCNFIGLEPLTSNWDEVFYSYYLRYGASSKNKISTQVVYVDYSVSEENPYSYVYYSDWASLNAVFLEKEKITYFNDICVETCLLSLDETSYRLRIELENATLRLDNISYTMILKEVKVVNNAPILLANVSDILITKGNSISIDLSEYFSDQDNDSLQYVVYEMKDVSVLIDESIAVLIPDDGFTGIRYTFITANDSKAIAVSNVFKVNVIEAEEILEAEVIVVKNITKTPTQLEAKINNPVKWAKKVNAENNESTAKNINVSFSIPEKAFNLAVKDIKLDKLIDKNKIVVKPNKEMSVLKELKEDKTKEKEFEFEDSFEINETKEYIVEYETEAPIAIETNISDYKKQIVISSDIHYVNVLAYTDVSVEATKESVKLYWLKNGTRELFDDVKYYDLNNNSLIDRIEWIIPSLSNQTFEVEITVLNVQSYPTVGGEWTVRFETSGTANLTIRAVNGTTYGDSAPADLKFIELKCGDKIVNVIYDNSKVFVADYECNETAYHTVRVLTEGVHTQEFRFGDAYAYANNLAGQIPKTLNIQGKLTDSSGSALTGNYNFSFKIYNVSSGGTKLWEENQTLAVQDGIYDAILGSSVALTLDFDRQYYLGIQVGTDDEMAPRLNLTSSPYIYRASFAENISLYSTGGLIMDSTGLSLNRSCGNNEILKWDGSSWNCAGDSGIGSEADTLATVTGRGNTTTQPLTIDSDGDETTIIGGDLEVQGNITGSSPVKIKGGLNVLNASGTTQLYVNDTTGYVGIGTTTPSQKLEVNGNINVSGDITSASSIEYNIGSSTMDNISDVTINGVYNLDYLGWSVSYAGDVNGDGYADVIIGAYMSNAGGPLSTWKGQAHILFGNSTMDNTPDVTMTGLTNEDRLGIVSYAGDVNGDGYSDVIVGADRAEGGGTQRGEAYIYFGGSSMNNAADVTMSGLADNDYLGYAVSYAGDVNGDGYDDVIVGAYGAAIGGTLRGQAHVYFGGPDMDGTAEFTMNGSGDSNYFGYSVSYAGDVNGDGYADVIVGAYGAGTGGETYLYLGGPDMDNVADVTMSGAAGGDEFGYDVSYAGDVNGDGYDDVIVGARGAGSEGEAYIYFGGPNMDNTIDITMNSSGGGGTFGRQVSYAGDINGDDYSDVIIGDYSAGAGGAYIYFGGSNMDNTTDITLIGAVSGDYFGYSVSYAGDVNGDGYDDVVIGAKNADPVATNDGRAYVYYSSGNRWKSIFAQEINLKTGIHIGELILNRYGLETWTSFGIKSPNWEIDRVGTASFQDAIVGTNLTVDSGTLFVDGKNNKVGIGTETPTQKLEVAGSINVTSSGNVSLGNNQKIYLGNSQEIALYYNGTHFVIDGT